MTPKLTIKNETGLSRDTQLVTADGLDLCKVLAVQAIDISLVPDDVTRADVTIGVLTLDLPLGRVRYLAMNPRTGKLEPIKSMTFADGSVSTFDEDGTFTNSAAPAGAPATP